MTTSDISLISLSAFIQVWGAWTLVSNLTNDLRKADTQAAFEPVSIAYILACLTLVALYHIGSHLKTRSDPATISEPQESESNGGSIDISSSFFVMIAGAGASYHSQNRTGLIYGILLSFVVFLIAMAWNLSLTIRKHLDENQAGTRLIIPPKVEL